MRLLLVEDDPMLGASVRKGFDRLGFVVDWVLDGAAALCALKDGCYSVVMLDLGLPRLSGLEVLRTLRQANDRTPVIILSARDAVDNRIEGLDAGADDYLDKPFDLNELGARVRALIRRSGGRSTTLLRHGAIAFDTVTRVVTYRGQAVPLGARELALLAALLERPGAVLSRSQLVERIYGWQDEVESNTIEVHIHSLRRKLSRGVIRNSRGLGYMLAEEGAALVD